MGRRTSTGLWARPDSPYWWIVLPRQSGQRAPHRETTKIPRVGPTDDITAEYKRLAALYCAQRLTAQAKGLLGLNGPDLSGAETFARFAAWWRTNVLPTHRGADREREILGDPDHTPPIGGVLEPAFGACPLHAITQERVHEWMTTRVAQQRRGQTITTGTVNREVDLLKSMMRDAVRHKRVLDPESGKPLKISPLLGMKRLHVKKRPRARLTPDQEDAVLAAIGDPSDRAMVIMGLDTLARMGDILDFERSHDHGRTLTIIDPKNGELLELPVSRRLRKALDTVPRTDPRYYFAKRRVAKKARDWRSSVRQMLEAACRRAEVTYGRINNAITWHAATRRTGASRMLAKKIPITTVMHLGGWKTLEQVKDYQVPEEDVLREAVEVVGRRRRRAR